MPHRVCLLNDPILLWLHVVSDLFIAIAYTAIPIALIVLIAKVENFVTRAYLACSVVYVLFCGFTHYMEVVVMFEPVYWLAGAIKFATALISIFTAAFLLSSLPLMIERFHLFTEALTEIKRLRERGKIMGGDG